MPGNFQLTSGFNVTFNTSGFSDKSKNVEDNSINGKYLIVATRQIIKNNKHETIIEVVTDSTNEATSYTSSQQQNQTLKGY
jgi:predicted RNA-binding protein